MTKTENLGYVDHVAHGVAGGWVSGLVSRDRFFVEIDGEKVGASLTYSVRDDLVQAGVNGIGFRVDFDAPAQRHEVRFGVIADDSGYFPIEYLPFSLTGEFSAEVDAFPRNHAVIGADDLNEIARAIDPDSELYHQFLSKYADIDGVLSAPVDVLFVDGTGGSVSTRYRINYIAEGLQDRNYITRCVVVGGASLASISKIKTRVVVFFRAPYTKEYEFLLSAFRAQGSRVIFDIDDLVVDPDLISKIDGVRYLSHHDAQMYHRGMKLYRKFALSADVVTCATAFLADYVSKLLDVKTAVVRNSIGRRYIKHYSNYVRSEVRSNNTFVIGYYSGSKTHQRDFRQAVDGLAKFLKTYNAARFRVVGMLDLDEFPVLSDVSDRIEIVAAMPYHRMIADIDNCDVIIAPLDVGDPFCESKSELKFFEAALRSRPCVASPTRTYREAVGDGKYGILADSSEAWFDALDRLYLSPELRQKLARSAFIHARAQYSYEKAADDAAVAYFGLPARDGAAEKLTKPSAVDTKSINIAVIIPDLVIGGGGHRKILRFCRDWFEQGHTITLYVDTAKSLESVRLDITTFFFDFKFEIFAFRGFVQEHDVIVCTHWSTAYAMRKYDYPKRVFYFVQDFEPMFSPVSSDYVKSLGTYELGFHLVPFGAWVSQRIEAETGVSTNPVDFTVDLERYLEESAPNRDIDILFFARPSQPRRCFELGVEALRLIHESNPATRIALYGEDNYGDLGFSYTNLGMITDLDRLVRIYNRTRLGICFSTTNPSSVGYEMLACGTNLLDVKVPGWKLNFDGDRFVHYASLTPDSVADVAARALNDPSTMDMRRKAGSEFVKTMSDDSAVGRQFMAVIQDKL